MIKSNSNKPKENHYLFFTGGKDSLLSLYLLLSKGIKPTLVLIDYNQSSLRKEKVVQKYYSELFKLKMLNYYFEIGIPKAISEGVLSENKSSHVILRNPLFLLNFANRIWEEDKICTIYYGAHEFDLRNYDGDVLFCKKLNRLVRYLYNNIYIKTVIGKYHEKDILNELYKIKGVDLSHLVFCEHADIHPSSSEKLNCGKCTKCTVYREYAVKHGFMDKIKPLFDTDIYPKGTFDITE